MLNKIRNNPKLKEFISDDCEESGIYVSMADDIPPENHLILKVDRFYNSLNLGHLGKTPKSIDCLIPLKCIDDDYLVYLIELKRLKSGRHLKVPDIFDKFETTIKNFMSSRFKNIFFNEKRYQIKKLHLYFVSNPYRESEESHRRKKGSEVDSLLLRKVFKFQGLKYQVKHKLPNPIIAGC